ncbi:MAG: DUF202 domain-containing protein [Desulfocurvibacter africanus]
MARRPTPGKQSILDDPSLSLGDRLSIRRTMLSTDRTLLSWTRTAISFIGFGFTIYKVFEAIVRQGLVEGVRPQTPRNLGLFLISIGTLCLMFMLADYVRAQRFIGLDLRHSLAKPAFWAAGAICLLGLSLVVVVLFAPNAI